MFSHAGDTHISFTMIVSEGLNQWKYKFNRNSIVYEVDDTMMEDGSVYSYRRTCNYVNKLCDFLTTIPFLRAEQVFCCENASVDCAPYSRIYENHACLICDGKFLYHRDIDKMCEQVL
jgi:hypothetical protein